MFSIWILFFYISTFNIVYCVYGVGWLVVNDTNLITVQYIQ